MGVVVLVVENIYPYNKGPEYGSPSQFATLFFSSTKSPTTTKLDFNYFHQKPNPILFANNSEKQQQIGMALLWEQNYQPPNLKHHLVQILVKYTHFALFMLVRYSKVSIYSEESVNINLIIPNPQNGNMID